VPTPCSWGCGWEGKPHPPLGAGAGCLFARFLRLSNTGDLPRFEAMPPLAFCKGLAGGREALVARERPNGGGLFDCVRGEASYRLWESDSLICDMLRACMLYCDGLQSSNPPNDSAGGESWLPKLMSVCISAVTKEGFIKASVSSSSSSWG
jgi:hypothetical protein